MRLLFIKNTLAWPRSSGHDVHAYYMMKACAALGHEVSLACMNEPSAEAVKGLTLTNRYTIAPAASANGFSGSGTWLQRHFRSYFGVPDAQLEAIDKAATAAHPDAIIVVGLTVLPYFAALPKATRVWFAADELAWHHVSQMKIGSGRLAENAREAVIKTLYERAHRGLIDRAWVVSDSERRAMEWIAGMRTVDVLPNGVDADYYRPVDEPPQDRTAVFWGRLDFGPNIQALEWFCRAVWPRVRRAVPDARFTIVGFKPLDAVLRLQSIAGVSIVGNLEDLRTTVRQHAVAVLPFVSGGGIKNKLLEAAALGMPIVCTPRATSGLRGRDLPLAIERTAASLADAVVQLWQRPDRRRELGAAARAWVVENHSWESTARQAIAALTPPLPRPPGVG